MDWTIIVALLAFIAVGAAGFAFAGQGAPKMAAKRVKAVSGRVAKRKDAAETATLRRRQNMADALKELGQNEKQSRKRRVSVKGRLAQAGLNNVTETTFWLASAITGAVLAGVGFFLQAWIGAAVGGFIGLFGLPRWWLGFMVAGRQKKFTNQLADAIDIIVRGVKSGLPLNQCLRIIADESSEPLASEFRSVVDGQAMGMPFEQNLQRLYEHMPLPEVNFFVIVLTIQQKTGGNLSESLGNLSTVLRSRKLMREKVKALSSEAKASAMIIGSLPFIVMGLVYIVQPGYMAVLFTTPTGNLVLMGAAAMMTTGILVMRQMINFKF